MKLLINMLERMISNVFLYINLRFI